MLQHRLDILNEKGTWVIYPILKKGQHNLQKQN